MSTPKETKRVVQQASRYIRTAQRSGLNQINAFAKEFDMPRAGSGKYLNLDMLGNAGGRLKKRHEIVNRAVKAVGEEGSYWDELWRGRGRGGKSMGRRMLGEVGGTALNWFGAADWGKAMGGPGGMKRAAAIGIRAGAAWGALQGADFLNPFGFGSISD
jgi:hypothetical protein